jgi:hypothetical protein
MSPVVVVTAVVMAAMPVVPVAGMGVTPETEHGHRGQPGRAKCQ